MTNDTTNLHQTATMLDPETGKEFLACVPAKVSDDNTFPAMLSRAKARGVNPSTIIDVGASTGIWSRMAHEIWPAASMLLIEADERHYAGLDAFCAKTGAVAAKAMASNFCRVGHFASDPNDPWGGQGSLVARPDTHEVHTTTVDVEVAFARSKGPFLLKLDTHGFEVPILEGASGVLANACALVIEAYTCKLSPECLRFWELCAWLERVGFVMTDFCEPMRRPLDGRLWQWDFLYERSDAPNVGVPRYK